METEKRTKHKEFYRAQLLNDKRPFWKIAVSLLLSLLGTVLFIVLGLKFLVYFMPFVLGWFLAYIATPVVEWLERRLKIVKKIGSVLLIIGVLAAVIFLIYLIFSVLLKECATLIRDLPDMYGDLGKGIRTSAGGMDGILEKLPKQTRGSISTMFKDLDKTMGSVITDVSQPTVTAAGNFAKKIPSIIVGTIVTILSAYFFIAERENVIIWSKQVAPDPIVKRMSMVMSNLKYAVGGYLKAQFKIMGVVFAILLIGFLVCNIHFAVLFALVIAFLDFLPFFGTGTAMIPWAIYQFFVGNYKRGIALLVIHLISQLVRQFIQPKLVGDSMGLNPLFTLVLLYIGYKIGSVLGMIFAVPVGMIVLNLYNAGAFDYILDDVFILADRLVKLREPEL